MKKILNLALGLCALGAASVAVTPEAHAVTWGPTVTPASQQWWSDQAVEAQLWTSSLSARLLTYAASNNQHRGGMYVNCQGQPLVGFPTWGVTWYGEGLRVNYQCPGWHAPLVNAFGWVDDNYYQ